MQNSLASDGYVWTDAEQRYTQEFGGYTIEIAVHHSGYRHGMDATTSHSRRRYRLISKAPNVSALPPDPSLWIVHYSQADPQACIPVNQVMVTPQVRQQLQERQWIEAQGRLEQQPFMLHDRERWPHVSMPGRTGHPGPMYNAGLQNQNPMAHIGNPRFSGQFYQQAAQQAQVGPSPAKRARQHAPSQMPASAAALMATDTSIEDEENVLYGDILDHLTQRDVSLTRYVQHHEWMEEVYSSPYATGNIVPADLGLGLMGELAGLTDGLMDLPSTEDKTKANNATEASFKKVTPEQLSEFEKRVKVHMEKGQAELDRMKEEHAKKMDRMKKSKMLLHAEKRLRHAVWDPADTGNQVWRLDRAAITNPDAADAHQKEAADDIVKEVEAMLGGVIKPQKEATLVEKGGLKEKRAAPPPSNNTHDLDASPSNMMQLDGSFDQQQMPSHDQFAQQTTAGSEQQPPPSQPPSQPAANQAQPPQQHQQQTQPQQTPQLQQQHQQQQQVPTTQQANPSPPQDIQMDNSEAMMDDSLMSDINMDMDVDTSNLDFDHAAEPSPKHMQQSAPDVSAQDEFQMRNPTDPQQQQQHLPSQLSHPNPATSSAHHPSQPEQSSDLAATGTGDMFSTSTNINNNADSTGGGVFNDFDTTDGLIDFDGGDFGDMDNSAFGDAFHGTEAHGDNADGSADQS